MALTRKPKVGEYVEYRSEEVEIYQVVGWMNNDRTIAHIAREKTGNVTQIIMKFANGDFNALLTITPAPKKQCPNCGCTPCECYDLYPYCHNCQKFAVGYDSGEACPDCNHILSML